MALREPVNGEVAGFPGQGGSPSLVGEEAPDGRGASSPNLSVPKDKLFEIEKRFQSMAGHLREAQKARDHWYKKWYTETNQAERVE